MRAAVAAGHPATTDAGIEILQEGGTAADATVAASLASCVAETLMTGLLGGGHAIYYEAETGRARNLDCFVAVPGLGAGSREVALVELDVPFGQELVHYAVGIGSCGVPGLPAGLHELWTAHGRLSWARLCEPALRLARAGVELPAAHAACLAMLAPVMTMNEGARIYAPGGALLREGQRLVQPGLADALGLLADEGALSAYQGTLGDALVRLMEELGGLVTRRDLLTYRARWAEPVAVQYCGAQVLSRSGLSTFPEAIARLGPLSGLTPAARALELVAALADREPGGHTTNVSVVDAAGNACVLTTSLGLGSGDFLVPYDLHLNSMLGEADLVRGPLEPSRRLGSMMAPALTLDRDGLLLAAGAAGGTRLRGALVQVVAGILDEGLAPAAAVEQPRLHPAGSVVHLEPGFDPGVAGALRAAGFEARVWPARHHFFGGVSVVARDGAAGDPRRSGTAELL